MSALPALLNVALRGGTLFGKLVLVFFMARFVEPGVLGQYGLIVAALGWLLYFAGVEFYTHSTRDLIVRPEGQRWPLLRDQFLVYLATYLVAIPLLLVAHASGWLPPAAAGLLALIFVADHLGLELNRILIAIGRPLQGGVVLFLRGAAWIFLLVPVMWLIPEWRTLNAVLMFWAVGSIVAFAVGLVGVLRVEKTGRSTPIDRAWIASGLRVAIPMMLASLTVRTLFAADRYFIDALGDPGALAAYVLYVSIATAILSLVDAAIVDFDYPALVASAQSGDEGEFERRLKKLALKVAITSTALVLLTWAVGSIAVAQLDNPAYRANWHLFGWLLFALWIYALSTVPHIALYARRIDRPIVHSQAAGLTLFLLLAWLGRPALGATAIPMALAAAFLLVLVWKLLASHRTRMG